MAGADSAGLTYSVSISVQLSGVHSKTDFDVIIYNPCVDEDYLLVEEPIGLVHDFTHTLGECEVNNSWTHDSFLIDASAEVKALCGGLSYTVDAGVLTQYITYDPKEKQISICAEDRTLLDNGPYAYTVTSHLMNYKAYGIASESGSISLLDQCASP